MMIPYINLLPYMNRIEDVTELLESWNGGIEVSMDGPTWRKPLDWDREIQRFADYTGPKTVHAPIWDLNLATPRFDVFRQYSLEVYEESIKWAARIDAKHVVIHPSLYSSPIFLRRESQDAAKECLRKLGETGQSMGVEVAVENVGFGDLALFNQEEFIRLFEEIPTIHALVDVGHAHINQWDTPALIKALGNRLTAVHLHDNEGSLDSHLPIGRGTIAWQPIWDALNSLDHEYRAILEYKEETPKDILLQHIEELYKNLKGQI